jgi:hypothetical protein
VQSAVLPSLTFEINLNCLSRDQSMNEIIDRHAPIGFYNLAEDFYQAAMLCAAAREKRTVRLRFNHVPYYLHTHSIELALKAYLRTHSVTEAELKKAFRHGFVDLLAKCEVLGLKFRRPKRTRQLVDFLNELTKDQAFRYFYGGARQLPTPQEMREGNERILAAVKPACLRSIKVS